MDTTAMNTTAMNTTAMHTATNCPVQEWGLTWR
jgi:hypothetical protein